MCDGVRKCGGGGGGEKDEESGISGFKCVHVGEVSE